MSPPSAAEGAAAEENAPPVPAPPATPEPPRARVATRTLGDGSLYQGEVDATDEPHGVGVLRARHGAIYAGDFYGGQKHGFGVQTLVSGAMYAGAFADDQPSGFGVHTSPFAEKYVGEWHSGAREGVGMSIDADAKIVFGRFTENEPVDDERVPWAVVEESVRLALVAERRATQRQEAARERQLQAALGELSAVESTHFEDAAQIAAYEAQEQRALEQFVSEQSAAVAEIERAADVFKLRDAELKQHQKRLRAEIDARAKELSLVAHYCELAGERQTQVDDAERTLRMLQWQLEQLEEDTGTVAEDETPHAAKIERVAVLSMNIFARPEGIHSGKWFSNGDYKDLRVSLLLRKMRDFDIVLLQEMFEVGVRQKRLVREARAMGFKYHCGSVWPSVTDRYLIDGGLLILSRFPIVERGQHAYSQGSGSDGICAKGVLYARVQLSPDLGDSLHVFTTHTQAGDRLKEYAIRAAQLQEMQRFVARTVRDDREAPVLITGDFNLDARHNLAHDARRPAALPVSTACLESDVYQQLVRDFEAALGPGRRVLDLMKHHDTTRVGGAVHPITNGDGHSSLVHVADPYALDKDGKCIDYMFFSPGSRARRASAGDAPGSSLLRVVETRTSVDHCDVAPLVDGQLRLPITHLSDHYALRAEFELELAAPVAHPHGGHDAAPLYELLELYFPQRAFAQTPERLWMWKLTVGLLAISGAVVAVVGVVASALLTALGIGAAAT
ncbi:hypothetical protein PybrP1_012998 [[Pythium] brassicae (nom. inval.)]|nr:hypothetical protein PybrP1_012998 [[Pythium] brassicae (nom. inval.)]